MPLQNQNPAELGQGYPHRYQDPTAMLQAIFMQMQVEMNQQQQGMQMELQQQQRRMMEQLMMQSMNMPLAYHQQNSSGQSHLQTIPTASSPVQQTSLGPLHTQNQGQFQPWNLFNPTAANQNSGVPSNETVHVPSNPRGQYIGDYSTTNAVSIGKRFGHKEKKYSWSDDENLKDFIDQYYDVCRDLRIPNRDAHQFMHNLFRDQALRFYHANVAGKTRDIQHAVRIMQDHFNSLSNYNRYYFHNSWTKQTTIVSRHLVTWREILRSDPLFYENCKTEERKVGFLRQALLSEESQKAGSSWNCGRKGHRVRKCDPGSTHP